MHVLARLHDELVAVTDWKGEALHQIVVNLAETLGLGMGKVAQPLRVAVCGSAVSPAIDCHLVIAWSKKKPWTE